MALFEEKVVILIASFVASDEPIFHSFRLRDQYFFYRMERGGGGGGGETEIFGQGHMVFRGNGEGNQSSSTENKGGV